MRPWRNSAGEAAAERANPLGARPVRLDASAPARRQKNHAQNRRRTQVERRAQALERRQNLGAIDRP
jgi:hypothetical protein